MMRRRLFGFPRPSASGAPIRRHTATSFGPGTFTALRKIRPAVISINMQMASTTVNELLARVRPYRYDDNAESAIVRTSFIQAAEYREREPAASGMFAAHIGKGDVRPLLLMPELSEPEDAD